MSMFCYQCQEAKDNVACTTKGVCGKDETVAGLQDVLMHVLKGISLYSEVGIKQDKFDSKVGRFLCEAMFATITNANFDDERFISYIDTALTIRNDYAGIYDSQLTSTHDSLTWNPKSKDEYSTKAPEVSIDKTENEDVRSLRELAVYGLKGMSAYVEHAAVLGFEDEAIYKFVVETLALTTKNLSTKEMIAAVMKVGEYSVTAMALLDKANTETYGNPEMTKVNIGVGNKPGILVSGHDLHDLKELLEQTKGSGVDVYTHCEMLPAHSYPEFKKYDNFVGNYGNAWWEQRKEFTSFNGPILMTTNCITPVKKDYEDRIYTTGVVGYKEVQHVPTIDGKKDFSTLIKQARKCDSPIEIEKGEIIGGFAHHQVFELADKVVAAVKSGAIKKFVVMAGCDARQSKRTHYTDRAKNLPKDEIILTAGCAKFRYNKLDLGDIGGIPRVLDAGQCNDSYSLAVIAMKLKEVFELDDINDLPIEYDIAWYEQKAVTVLLALLHLGVKNIRLGPTLPAFLSPNVANVLVENFGIKGL